MPEPTDDVGKSHEEAETKIAEAKRSLDEEEWAEALELLNSAVLLAPSPSASLSSALHCRALALLGLKESSLALRDATLAGIKGYWPESRLYLLYRLQARCQAALGEGGEAVKCLHRALSALDRSDLEEEGRAKEKQEIQEQQAAIAGRKEGKKKRERKQEETVRLASPHRLYPCLSSCLSVQHSVGRGRHVVVRGRSVQPGEVLGVEEPLVHCLERQYLHKRCSYCLASVLAPLPCATCRQVKVILSQLLKLLFYSLLLLLF